MVIDADVTPAARTGQRTTETELVVAPTDAPAGIVEAVGTPAPLVAVNIGTVLGAVLVAGLILLVLGLGMLVAVGAVLTGLTKASRRRGRSW